MGRPPRTLRRQATIDREPAIDAADEPKVKDRIRYRGSSAGLGRILVARSFIRSAIRSIFMIMDIHSLYAKLNRQFRVRRMRRFAEAFGIDTRTRILDVGGSHYIWMDLPVRPKVVLLNLLRDKDHGDDFTDVIGDARHLPFKDKSFDLVFSNSLIEHLFTFDQQRRFADDCRRVAARYYVQSPNQHFFLEPHLLTPFIHWLPKRARMRLLRNFTIWGLITRPTRADCEHFVEEVRMLSKRDLRRLFPDAEIWHERVLGMSKSLMAVRNAP